MNANDEPLHTAMNGIRAVVWGIFGTIASACAFVATMGFSWGPWLVIPAVLSVAVIAVYEAARALKSRRADDHGKPPS